MIIARIAVVDLDLGLDLGSALYQIVEMFQARGSRRAGEIDRDQIDTAFCKRRAPVGLPIQIVVDECKIHFGMIEDVIHVCRAEHGVDGHPNQAGAMNAE